MSAPFKQAQPTIPALEARAPTTHEALDADVARLQQHKQEWARLAIREKIQLLRQLVQDTAKCAERWVTAACQAKGIPLDSPLAGEEWTSGPWALMYGTNGYLSTLEALAAGRAAHTGKVRTRRDGQVIAQVFPQTASDALLLNGITAEVWMEPGVTEASLPSTMGAFYKLEKPAGHVALVLGAGNIASIGPLDVLYKLIAEGQVCLLKMNPVNEYLGSFFVEAFDGFIKAGYVAIAYGAADVGEYLCSHAGIEEIHITGSAVTHDAIVFGSPEAKASKTPRNPRRITSELGNVSPIIVVPGPWTPADLRYQAEHIATMKMHNGGFNCIAGQVLVLPKAWDLSEPLWKAVEAVLRGIPNRKAYYPGAEARQRAAATTSANLLDPVEPGFTPRTLVEGNEQCFHVEAFCSVLGRTMVDGADAATFLERAVAFCNNELWGTLGANLLIHPRTIDELGAAFEDAIAALRYGCVAINAWTGVGFLLGQTTWGAFPGHTADDIRSGVGVVHNTLLFDRPQKSVVRQSFYAAPRGLLHGDLSLLPKPPWFVTNRTAATTAKRLVGFEVDHSWLRMPGIFASALQG
jgi:acyl-CoA reductase-like NAD-dependent aldehyde dehydrogenase